MQLVTCQTQTSSFPPPHVASQSALMQKSRSPPLHTHTLLPTITPLHEEIRKLKRSIMHFAWRMEIIGVTVSAAPRLFPNIKNIKSGPHRDKLQTEKEIRNTPNESFSWVMAIFSFCDGFEQWRRWVLIGQCYYACRCGDRVARPLWPPGLYIHNAEKTDIHSRLWDRVITCFQPEVLSPPLGQYRPSWTGCLELGWKWPSSGLCAWNCQEWWDSPQPGRRHPVLEHCDFFKTCIWIFENLHKKPSFNATLWLTKSWHIYLWSNDEHWAGQRCYFVY